MDRKKASELFHQVDPNLKVIDGGTHHHKRKPRHLTIEDWERTKGTTCLNCGQETLRIVDGVCLQCYRNKTAEEEAKLGRKREKRYLVRAFNEGRITLSQMREGRLS